LDLAKHPSFQDALRRLAAGGEASLSGLTTTAKALYSVLLWQSSDHPLIIVVDGNKQAEALSEAIHTFFSLLAADDRNGPQLLPALDVLPLQNLSPHAEICEQRATGLWRLATQRVPITVMPVAAALMRIEPGDYYRQLALKLRVGDELPLEEVVAHLESIGYERREPVEMVGEYSVRGGILDVFSPEAPKPIRLDLFGDQVESIRRFDVESQRSVLKIEDCTLLPLTEWQKSRALLVRTGGTDARSRHSIAATCRRRASRFPAGNWWPPCSGRARRRSSPCSSAPSCFGMNPSRCAAAERFWKRLEQIERSPAYDPDRIYFRWEELERQAGAVRNGSQGTRHRLVPGGRTSPHRHPALHGLSRQHAGGHRRGPHAGGSRQSRGVLRFFYR
jgi:transcription-repair coupling factor (superfamily II helicase)